jgi:hypothetical protein
MSLSWQRGKLIQMIGQTIAHYRIVEKLGPPPSPRVTGSVKITSDGRIKSPPLVTNCTGVAQTSDGAC